MAAGQGDAGNGDECSGQTHGEEELAAPVRTPHGAAVLDVDETAITEAANRRVRAATDLDGERFDRDVERDDGTRSAPRARSSTRWRTRMKNVRAVKRAARVGAVGATRVDRRPQRVQHDGRLVGARRRARMQPARTRGHDLDEARTRERGARPATDVDVGLRCRHHAVLARPVAHSRPFAAPALESDASPVDRYNARVGGPSVRPLGVRKLTTPTRAIQSVHASRARNVTMRTTRARRPWSRCGRSPRRRP